MRFIVDHATEDERHSNLLKKLVDEVEQSRPTLRHQILYAFDCFHQVYPMSLWLGSFERAQKSVETPEFAVNNGFRPCCLCADLGE